MTTSCSKLRNQLFCRTFITAVVIIALVFLDCNFFNEANAGIIGKIGEAAEKIGKMGEGQSICGIF